MSAALLVELFNNNSRGRLERQFRDRFLDLVGNFINTATYLFDNFDRVWQPGWNLRGGFASAKKEPISD
jgi:hypothetical protein